MKNKKGVYIIMDYNVLDFGAKGNGKDNDALAIQKAIDACHTSGGGKVIIPGGYLFKSGSIELKSNVEFHIEQGAVLKASDCLEDYAPVPGKREVKTERTVPSYINCEYTGRPFHYFIYARDGHDISITGLGKIDGSEEIYHGVEGKYHIDGSYYPRIPMCLFENISQLTVREVTMTRCGFWTLHMAGCVDVLVDGIRIINSLIMANCDGIDPDHCQNVRIVNCHIECADDCIVFKNSEAYKQYGPCQNIIVSGCTLISTSAAIKFGSESVSDFRNIVVENCCISKSNRGISLQLRDGGNIENVIFSNINIETRRFSNEWWGKAEPIYITAIDRKEGVKAGHIKNIHFQNINCIGENGIFLSGSPDNILKDITFDRVRVTLRKASKWTSDCYDIRPCQGEGLIQSKINGFYCKYAQQVSYNDIQIVCEEEMKDVYDKDFLIIEDVQ